MELKDAFESMNYSTEQLEEVLTAAKQSSDKQLNNYEFDQIQDMLQQLKDMFIQASSTNLAIKSPRGGRGDVQSQKVIIEQITQKYQAMEALVANMAETLMGLEGVRDRFINIYGGYESFMASLGKSQQNSMANRLSLTQTTMLQTRETLIKGTAAFRNQLDEQITMYEALGAELYHLVPAVKFVPNTPHAETVEDANNGGDGNNGDGNTEPNDENQTDQNGENQGTQDGEAASAEGTTGDAVPVEEEERQFIPPPAAGGAAPSGEQQGTVFGGAPMGGGASAVPSGGEQQGTVFGGAPMGGGASAAPSGGEHQGTVLGGAPMGGGVSAAPIGGGVSAAPPGGENQGAGLPGIGSAATLGAATGMGVQGDGQHSATEMMNQLDRGRKDERQKKSTEKEELDDEKV